MKTRNQLKILLIQIRKDEKTIREEIESFAKYANIHPEQIVAHNVFEQPIFDPNIAKGFDAVFIGGASDASVLRPDKYPFVDSCIQFIQYCIKNKIPSFASCFGFQLAVLAMKGEIISTPENFEMGTLPIQITTEGKKDILFQDTPNDFLAISVHQEKAITLPQGCTLLAQTNQCCHAFKIENTPFWAFQFHPELDRATLVERLTTYKKKYTDGDGQLDQVLSSAQETPESNLLVKKFIDRVLLKQSL